MITTSLDGLSALITGASRGLGREMALSLASAGAHVIGTGRDLNALASVAAAVTELAGAGHFTPLPLDVTDSKAVEAAAASMFPEQPIDILINSAGVATVSSVANISDADWAQVLTTNLTGTFYVCRSFGPRMLARGSGCVLNIASDIGIRGEPLWAAYAASKGGVIALSKTLAWEWAPTLRVNVLAPGAFPTQINRELLSEQAVLEGLIAATPLQRLGVPAEIGPITAFLVSPANDFMTGTVVPFDGGDPPLMINYPQLYMGGQWVDAQESGMIAVVNPFTEHVVGTCVSGGASDVDRAVRAARAAFNSWSGLAPSERADLVRAFAAILEHRLEEMAALLTAEVGAPLSLTRARQVPGPIMQLRLAADRAADVLASVTIGNSKVHRAPAGVVAAIAPWNFPLLLGMNKVAPALAVGCTVVLKPSEITPLHAFLLAEIAHDAGLPAGVFNIVTGGGSIVGAALSSHPEVDVVSLTGSTAAGRLVAAAAAGTIKKVHLELGGKSASVILPDAQLRPAVEATVEQCFINSGQTCLAWSRLLVPAADVDEAARIAAERADRFVLGDPVAQTTELGPLVSEAQRDRVRAAIERAENDGARLITGGATAPDHLPTGYFVRPTVFADVDPTSDLGQEEVFGPVLAIIGYRDEEDAVAIANGTKYGLHGAVFGADVDNATRVARSLRTGAVDINGGALNLEAPFGGYKQSGVGRELGTWGLEEYTEVTSLQY